MKTLEEVLIALGRSGFRQLCVQNWHYENANFVYEPAFLVSGQHPDVKIVVVENGTTGFTKVLPSGQTETGTWAVSENATRAQTVSSISFPIPLKEESSKAFGFTKEETKEIEEGETVGTSGCSGSVAEPTAPAGTLCVYTAHQVLQDGFSSFFIELKPADKELGQGYGTSGALVVFPYFEGTPESPGSLEAWGSWAVTAP